MPRNKDELKFVEKEVRVMGVIMEQTRPCTISESIMQSCKEMKSMREGRMPKRSLSELFENIERWSKEEKE